MLSLITGFTFPGMIELLPFLRENLIEGADVETNLASAAGAHSGEEALPLCVSPGAFGQWAVTFPLDSKARDRADVEDKKKRS